MQVATIILLMLLASNGPVLRVDAVLTQAEANVLLDLMGSVTGLPTNWRTDQVLSACDNGWTGLRCTTVSSVQRISTITLGYRVSTYNF